MRFRRSRYDELSPRARHIIDTALEDGLPEADIVALVKEQTGETISKSALNRYKLNRWQVIRERIREQQQRARIIAEALRAHPTDDLIAAIEQYLQAAFLYELQEGKLDAAAKGNILARLADVRLKREKLDLARLKQDIERERLELEREKIELQRRREMLPGAQKTWELILAYFADHSPDILDALRVHSEAIATMLEKYFAGHEKADLPG